MQMDPIGYFLSEQKEKYGVPRQPGMISNEGIIRLNPHHDFEQALEGLEGFDRIWILFHFHQNTQWKPKVLPPRGGKKQGVFATRSPHRPNFIGLSCVELKKIEGLALYIVNHDLIDQTPILDIKPYLNYADSFQSLRQGWLDELEAENNFPIEWSEEALNQAKYLLEKWSLDLKSPIEMRLKINPFPTPNNRIKFLGQDTYELSYKTWRTQYLMQETKIFILKIYSGYDKETLQGMKSSRWDDLPIHQDFLRDPKDKID